MDIPEGQGDLIRTWHQEMPKNSDEYRIMLRISVMFNQFCNDSSNDVDHDKYLSDLRRQSIADLFFNKATILYPNLFRMTYEALKHHGFDKPPRPPSNSRYSRKVAWTIYPGDEFKAERESAIALVTQHYSKNIGAPSRGAASTQQVGTSSVGITSLDPLSYNSSCIPPSALPTANVQAQASGTPTTSTLPVYSQDKFQKNALNRYNATIRQLMHAYSQLQLTYPTMAEALPVPSVVRAPPATLISLSGSVPQFGAPTMPQFHPVPPIFPSSIPVCVPPQHNTHNPTVAPEFVSLHSHAHDHHPSAPANSNETR